MTERDFIMKMRIYLNLQKQATHKRVQRAEEALRIAKEEQAQIIYREACFPNPDCFTEDDLLNM